MKTTHPSTTRHQSIEATGLTIPLSPLPILTVFSSALESHASQSLFVPLWDESIALDSSTQPPMHRTSLPLLRVAVSEQRIANLDLLRTRIARSSGAALAAKSAGTAALSVTRHSPYACGASVVVLCVAPEPGRLAGAQKYPGLLIRD